jgi:hypothetical protein
MALAHKQQQLWLETDAVDSLRTVHVAFKESSSSKTARKCKVGATALHVEKVMVELIVFLGRCGRKADEAHLRQDKST